jgi:hypothetical protein
MADEQKSTSGGIPGLMQEFIAQLRGATERLEDLTGLGSSFPSISLPSLPGLRTWPSPGAFSAAQLSAITTGVAAQRRSIDALKTQLTAFDEQLAVLEGMIEPLAEWSKTWAELEDRLMHLRRSQPGSTTPDEPSH